MLPRHSLVFALALLAAPPLRSAEPTPPELRLPEVARPTRMTVALDVDPRRPEFDGRVEIDLELLRPTRLLWLNASRLEIEDARLVRGEQVVEAAVVAGGEEFAGFDFGAEIEAGPARLEIGYRGVLDAIESDGLFRQQSGEDWYVFSQFESTFARRAFPCFDEPSYRSPWRLTLRVPSGMLALANTAPVAERDETDGTRTVEFAETAPLPSYLIALGVGPFEVTEAGTWGRAKTPVRIVVPKGRKEKTAFAAEVTGELLAELEEYFDIPYAFGKLDNLAVPHTVSFGAMENPGLITYAERYLLLDPARSTLGQKRTYASVAAHENAHQWFGNYVTLAWWDDTWLNEGFADWIADKIVARWRPDWFGDADRVERRGGALRADSLASARQVRRPIRSNDDIVTAFDGISYAKGASLLAMFESWIGPESFRNAIRSYLRARAFGNATSDDFLAALGEAGGAGVSEAFASFLDQPGAPVVTFETGCPADAPARLVLTQRRYAPLGAEVPAGQVWSVPVVARIGAGEREVELRTLLDAASASREIPFCPEWVVGNRDGIGYYVSGYGEGNVAELAGRIGELSIGEQIALLGDVSLLLSAGEVSSAEALGLLPHFAGSEHRQVVESAVAIADSVDENMVEDAVRPNYERFLHAVFGDRARSLGLVPSLGESEEDSLLRPELVELLAGAGDDDGIAAEARKLADGWLEDRSTVAPEMVSTVLSIAARRGDATLFDRLHAAAKQEQDRRMRSRLLGALGSFRDPELVDRALGVLVSGEFDFREGGRILRALSRDRINRPRAFDWIRANFDALLPRIPQQYATYMAYFGAGFCDAERRGQVEEFFGPRMPALPGGEIVLGQVLEIIDICVARRAAQQGAVTEFLSAY